MLYLALARTSFARMFAYRGATVAGIVTNFFFGLLRAYVFIALFEAAGTDAIRTYTLEDALTFTALTQALIGPIYIWGWWEVAQTVRSGEIVAHLVRPYDFFGYWMARDMGRALFHLLFRGLPILVFFPLLFDLTWPAGWRQWAAVLLSTTLAVMLSFSWRFLVNVSALFFLDARGVARMAYVVMTFLSGFLVPVALFPQWLRGLAAWTPMPSMVNAPIEVYLGIAKGPGLWHTLAAQLAWLAVMTAVARLALKRGLGYLVVQGG